MNANISTEEKRAALDRVLAVSSVADHQQLRDFLEFTGEKVIRGEAVGLTEYIVATQVLGKTGEFDPRLDPLVRSCARRVRRKLAHYYKTEGAKDPVWLKIPRGAYLPEFVWRGRNLRGVLPAVFIAGLVLGIVVLAWVLYQVWPMQRAQVGLSSEGAGNAILSPFLHGSHRTILSVYDLPFVEDSSGNLLRLKDGSPETLDNAEPDSLKRLLVTPELGRSGALRPATGYTGTGEALSAALFGRYLAGRASGFDARPWSSLSRQEREDNNIVLLGAADMATVGLARGSTSDFRFVRLQHASGRWLLAIENLRPAAGERPLYESRMSPGGDQPEAVCALISFLPGRAPGAHWLVIAGATGAGTLGASEYLSSGMVLRDLPQSWFVVGGQPPGFEMLVRVPVRDARPMGAEYVLHHVYQR